MPASEPVAIIKQVVLLIASAAALYAIAFCLSYVTLPPPPAAEPVDTFRSDETIYMTPAKQIYNGRRGLAEPGRKVILIGSSNVQVGFDQRKLQAELPGFAVHNLAIGDNNISQARQIRELAMAAMSDTDIRGSVFVVGVWYGMFVDNGSRWHPAKGARHETDIDRERFRYGFWKRTGNGPVERVSDHDTHRAALLIHPLIALEKGARLVTADLRGVIFVRPPEIDERARDTVVFTAEQRIGQAAYRRTYMNTDRLAYEQYDELASLVREVTGRGARVIIADLAIPAWHARALPYDAQHRRHMATFLAANGTAAGLSYLDLRALDDPDSFYDDAHVRPQAQRPWIEALRDRIRSVASHSRAATSI
jgi:hypothetical protein